MRTIIAGSRGVQYLDTVEAAMRIANTLYGIEPTVVLSGTAQGADRLGEQWAAEHTIPVERHPADWKRYGKSAGYRRNKEMAENADALVAIWNGRSPGTRHMIELATKRGLKIHVEYVECE